MAEAPQRLVRIATISDTHGGHTDPGYSQAPEIALEATRANKRGVNALFAVGDIGDCGRVEPLEEIGLALQNYEGPILVVGGNHDTPEGLAILREMGMDILEGESRQVQIGGLQIGIYGQNGTMPYERRDEIRGLPWAEQIPQFHEYTRQAYLPQAKREIGALIEQGIDALIVLSHVPIFPQQISDSVTYPEPLEMTPEFMNFLKEVQIGLIIVVSGHSHSFTNRSFGLDNPLIVIQEATEGPTIVGLNVAVPNMRRAGRPMLTIFDILRMADGALQVKLLEE